MNEIEKRSREIAKSMLESKKVKYIIGYEKGTDSFHSSPCFVDELEDIEKLIWSPTCFHNLAVYLFDEKRKVLSKGETPDNRPIAIVAKGCDSKTFVELIKEKMIKREEVYIIGVPCDGIIDPTKIEYLWRKMKLPTETAVKMSLLPKGIIYIGEWEDKKITFNRDEILLDKCKECKHPNPIIYDVLVGNKIEPHTVDEYKTVKETEALPLEKRWEYWDERLSRCVRCYACRNVCPLCYCEECIVDPTNIVVKMDTQAADKANRPCWIEKSANISENLFFHLTRIFHMAGRCVDCGECERACALKIPLRKLTKKLEKDVKELFGYEAGVKIDEKPLLATYDLNDPEKDIK